VLGELLTRKSSSVAIVGACDEPIADVRHPRLAPLALFVQEPDRADEALTLVNHRLGEAAEEPLDVRLAYEQIQCELHDVGLHAGEAFRASAFERLANQRTPHHLEIVRVHLLRWPVPARSRVGLLCV
jgi:hypothetical protein